MCIRDRLDGACGAKMDGKEPYPYDFDRVYKTVRELQPDAVIDVYKRQAGIRSHRGSGAPNSGLTTKEKLTQELEIPQAALRGVSHRCV